MKKALLLYSGGLDSRLALKLLQKDGYSVEALFFKLPFIGEKHIDKFPEEHGAKIKILDATEGELLNEYLQLIASPKYGHGVSANPCIDCKIWMLKKAKEYAKDKFDLIATGEVRGQRPMSQTAGALKKIESEITFLVNRPIENQKIEGRSRKKQMALAEEFRIKYPTPGGGCLLCEKEFKNRIKTLVKSNSINSENLPIVKIGRHYVIEKNWFVVARDKDESILISKQQNHLLGGKGKPTVYFEKPVGKQKALELQKAFSTGASTEERKKFEKHKL